MKEVIERDPEKDVRKETIMSLAKIQTAVNQCDRCGSCLTVCPLYRLTQRETAAARGKLATVRALIEGGLTADAKIARAFEFCLLCKACTEICPSKIKTDAAMIEARQYTAETLGRRAKQRLIAGFMGSNALIKFTAGTLKLSRKTGLSGLLRGVVPLEHTKKHYQEMLTGPAALPSVISTTRSEMPEPKTKTSQPQRPESELPEPKMYHPDTPYMGMTPHARIAYFQGCAMKLFFPEASHATVNVLRKTAEVVVPESVCCGMPHLAHGMADQAKALAKKNIEAFTEADWIITDCASCGSSLKEYGQRLAAEPLWAERAQMFSQKVMGLSEYLYKIGYQPNYNASLKVTYHDPCHLVRGQGIKKQPRELLQRAAEYVEMPQADTCCGGAGTFYLDFPETAQQVLKEKVYNIESTHAEVVVTECPSCLMQLAKGEQQSGRFKVMHISQVL